ncbi:MAG: ABC transporter ATP-binding protein/permease [Sphaerochaetaceae bacterium]|nr:ABC transporter ATP-binding protein/permease [Sphaerochaetaceae bacterium]
MFEAIRRIIDFSGSERRNIYKAIVISFFRSLLSMLRIAAIYYVILAFEAGERGMRPAVTALILLGCSIIGTVALKMAGDLRSVHAGYFMTAQKRLEIADRLKKVPMGYFNDTNLGEVTGIATTVLDVVENQGANVLVTILSGLMNALVYLLCMPFFNIWFFLIVLAGMVVYLLFISSMERKTRRLSPVRQKNQAALVSKVIESLQGMSVIKSFNLTGKGDAALRKAIDDNRDSNLALEKMFIPSGMMQGISLGFFKAMLLLLAAVLFINGAVTMTYALMMVIVSFQVFADIEQTGAGLTVLRVVTSSIEEAEKVNRLPVMDENGKDLRPADENISLRHVSFSYGDNLILNDVDLEIPEKTMTAFVGASGAGKTTMAMLIARFWDVDKGCVRIGGRDVRDYTLESLMSQISVVFQNVYLFADTIENNIKFGNGAASHEDVVAAARKACCHDFIMSLPEGYATVIGEGGATLSGGEKQRISIARAILKNAPIIILDEATANVDPENEDKLTAAFAALTKDKTVIMVAHRLKTIRNADKIVVFEGGRITEGTHEELLAGNERYSSFIRLREEAAGWKLGS